MGSGGSGGVGAAGGLPPPTVREIHSEEMACTSGETERRGRGSGEVVRRLRLSFLRPNAGARGGRRGEDDVVKEGGENKEDKVRSQE